MIPFLSNKFPESVEFETVKCIFAIPKGFKFKKMQLILNVGDLFVIGDRVELAKHAVKLQDKNFPEAFFLIVERI